MRSGLNELPSGACSGSGDLPRHIGNAWRARVMVEFEDMVTSRATVLLRFALMLCGDPHLAEDLVQTVLAKAYRRWSKISKAEHPEAYLKTVIVNEHLGWWRRRSSRDVPTAEHRASYAPAHPQPPHPTTHTP